MSLAYVVESWTLYIVGTITIIARVGIRLKMVGRAGLKPDDYLMTLALVVYSLLTAMVFLEGKAKGTNAGLTPDERAALTPHQVANRAFGTKVLMVGWFIYSGFLWILKICLIFFFKRITLGLNRDKFVWWCFVSVGTTWIAIILTLFLTCRPWYKSFQVVPDPGPMCRIQNPIYYLVVVTLNVITDGLIMSIPLPLLIKSQIPLKRKIFLVMMFSATIFAMLSTILGGVLSFTEPRRPWVAGIWASRGTFVAIIVGNSPMILPLFTRRLWGSGGTSKNSHLGNSNPSQQTAMELSSRRVKRDSVVLDSDSTKHIVESDPALVITTEVTYEVTSQEADTNRGGYFAQGSTRNNGDSSTNGNPYNGYSATVKANS